MRHSGSPGPPLTDAYVSMGTHYDARIIEGCGGNEVYAGIHKGTLVYAYDIEGSMQGICLKVIVPIGE